MEDAFRCHLLRFVHFTTYFANHLHQAYCLDHISMQLHLNLYATSKSSKQSTALGLRNSSNESETKHEPREQIIFPYRTLCMVVIVLNKSTMRRSIDDRIFHFVQLIYVEIWCHVTYVMPITLKFIFIKPNESLSHRVTTPDTSNALWPFAWTLCEAEREEKWKKNSLKLPIWIQTRNKLHVTHFCECAAMVGEGSLFFLLNEKSCRDRLTYVSVCESGRCGRMRRCHFYSDPIARCSMAWKWFNWFSISSVWMLTVVVLWMQLN